MTAAALRRWVPDGVAALFVLVLGLAEGVVSGDVATDPAVSAVLVLGTVIAVGLARRAPGAALGLLWLLGLFQVASGRPIMLAELAVIAVFFGTARWGRPATMALGALSVPLALVIAFVLYQARRLNPDIFSLSVLAPIYDRGALTSLVLVLGLLLLVVASWPAGLALRFSAPHAHHGHHACPERKNRTGTSLRRIHASGHQHRQGKSPPTVQALHQLPDFLIASASRSMAEAIAYSPSTTLRCSSGLRIPPLPPVIPGLTDCGLRFLRAVNVFANSANSSGVRRCGRGRSC